MAASSVSTPMGRPSPESGGASPGSATGSSCARRTSASWAPSRRRPGSPRSTASSFDLGLSSFQLADRERGFGFRAGGPLDMRFDTSRGVPAAELLATLDADELAALFRRYGEEPNAGRIARAIVNDRRTAPIATAEELAALIERIVPPDPRKRKPIHPATRVFQALRIAVNAELDALEAALAAAMDLLRPGGRLVVLSYHSLEDRIVKRFIAAERRGCICPPEVPICVCGRNPRLRPLGKSLTARPEEVAANPRSRSARLRAAERIAA